MSEFTLRRIGKTLIETDWTPDVSPYLPQPEGYERWRELFDANIENPPTPEPQEETPQDMLARLGIEAQPLTWEKLPKVIAGLAPEIDPATIAQYLQELRRHFTNRVRSDPQRAPAGECLGKVEEAVNDGTIEKLIDAGFQFYGFTAGGNNFVAIHGENVILFGQNRGPGTNVGSAFTKTPEGWKSFKTRLNTGSQLTPADVETRLGKLISGNPQSQACKVTPTPGLDASDVPVVIEVVPSQKEILRAVQSDQAPVELIYGTAIGLIVIISVLAAGARRKMQTAT